MANKKQQNTSIHLKKTDDVQQQQQHLNSATENFIRNNSKFGYVSEDYRKIYIGNLKDEITQKDLSEHFSQFGEIQYIDVKVDSGTGRGRDYGFVVFKTMEGMDNALACNSHIINDMKFEAKKAIPRRIKLFVGGLSPNLTEDDITDYFKRFAHQIKTEMPFDKVKNQQKGYCFVTIENQEAVTEILRLPRHVIKGKHVDVNVAETRSTDYAMMPGALRPMIRVQGNVVVQGGFLPQLEHTFHVPGYHYGGYGYYNPYIGYYPNYHYNYPNFVAGAGTANQSEGNEASSPSGADENQIVE